MESSIFSAIGLSGLDPAILFIVMLVLLIVAFVLVFVMFAAVVPPMDASASGTVYVVGCEEWVSLRSRPSTSATALREVPLYSSVTYRGDCYPSLSPLPYNTYSRQIKERHSIV